MSKIKELYTIIKADGTLRGHRRGKTGSLYTSYSEALRQARHDGDSIVVVHYDTTKEPRFIRLKKVPTEE